jgi:hypothetical protein
VLRRLNQKGERGVWICDECLDKSPLVEQPPAPTCTNRGSALEDRAGKSYQCNGDAQWCTACLRWHYEPLLARIAELEQPPAPPAEAEAALERLTNAFATGADSDDGARWFHAVVMNAMRADLALVAAHIRALAPGGDKNG